jgi:hypothetical protein
LIEALDITTQLAMAAGLDALREAGIPLVQTYKRTSTGKVPARPLAAARSNARRHRRHLRQRLPRRRPLRRRVQPATTPPATASSSSKCWKTCATTPPIRQRRARSTAHRRAARRTGARTLQFDRRFLFRILAMGHSQFAQYIGARGPNTQVNAACASTAQAIAIAEDWIRSGRCRRVVVMARDDVTGENLMEWVGAGFLAVGAATTKDQVAEAALPFDRAATARSWAWAPAPWWSRARTPSASAACAASSSC